MPAPSDRDPADPGPGLLECCLVPHRGDSKKGPHLWTLCVLDIATSWICMEAVADTDETHTGPAIGRALDRFPFPAWGVRGKSGSVNDLMFRLCEERWPGTVRVLPEKPASSPAAQRAGYVVRRDIGRHRLESDEDLRLLRDALKPREETANLFESFTKLAPGKDAASKEKPWNRELGTPLCRLRDHYASRGQDVPENVAKLLERRDATDPFELYDKRVDMGGRRGWRQLLEI